MNRVAEFSNPTKAVPRARRRRSGTTPFSAFEWMLAWRYLRARRQEGWINVIAGFSLSGIGLGVATLIIVMAVMNGFRDELMGKILGFNGHFMVQGVGATVSGWDGMAKRLQRVPGVVRVTPLVEGQALATAAGTSPGVLVRGIRAADVMNLKLVADSLSEGAMQRFQANSSSILVGEGLANRMGLLPGMTVTLLAPRGNVTPFGVTPRAKGYTVAGTFKVGMSEYDTSVVFMPLAEAQAYFNMGKGVTGIEIMVADPDKVDQMRDSITAVVGQAARLVDWQQVNKTFFDALQVESTVMFFILSLIVVVAAFNIISGMIMMVKDKTRDIAILRTMGATSGTILRVFLISGSAIGIVGTVTGFLIGFLFCTYIEEIRQFLQWVSGMQLFPAELYFLSRMPAKMDIGEVIMVVISSLTISILATVYPAWRAAKLDPVDALRYE
ncbi:MAG: lipoprotein-releasing ABC transporter permease subunit [Alphaproteobacteria bacterium]|nr:lipoprotein-releasing ABC transporter permease subunit [Alphaproteobacteria bacterium]